MDTTVRELSYAQAIQEAMAIAMEQDERVILMGEDIGVYGGAFQVTGDLVERFGADRVMDTPISELGGAGVAVGAAILAGGIYLFARTGADAIIVSNHGGRQLDGAASSISKLEEIADAVGDRIEIHLDGGIRSGQDVLKALCLGAKGTYIGRPFLYGLGADGERGVTTALEIIRKELDITMALCGKRDIRLAGKDWLDRKPGRL